MAKYLYKVSGVDATGNYFESECVNISVIGAIDMYEDIGYIVHSIKKDKQVPSDVPIRIRDIKEGDSQ